MRLRDQARSRAGAQPGSPARMQHRKLQNHERNTILRMQRSGGNQNTLRWLRAGFDGPRSQPAAGTNGVSVNVSGIQAKLVVAGSGDQY